MKTLGKHQLNALNALVRHGAYPTSPWTYGNYSRTARLLNGLVQRGLATSTLVDLHKGVLPPETVWAVTDTGRALVARREQEKRHGV